MAGSTASENSSNSGSDFSDFEASIEDENNERALEPVGEIRPWRFEPPGRNENRSREEVEDQEPASIKKETNGECITLVNSVSENQSRLAYRMLVHSLAHE